MISSVVRAVALAALAALAALSIPFAVAAQSTAAPQAAPCSTAEYRQFDFWIGDWEVRRPDGRVVGHNKIEPALNGCTLVEQWTSTGNSRGTSLNFYDSASRQWHQTWIDNSGSPIYLNGGLSDGKMVLESQTKNAQGQNVHHRITWTPLEGGGVRQHWESSSDGARTWTTLFDGQYRKRS